MKLTHSLLHKLGTSNSGFNNDQLRILGVETPPKKGWLSKLIGTEIAEEDYARCMALKSVRNRIERREILSQMEADYSI